MKKGIFLAFVLLVASVSVYASSLSGDEAKATAQSSPACYNIISVNSWPYLAAFFNIGYERDIIANTSLRLRGEYWGLSSNGWKIGGFGADLFYHPMGNGLDGWYFGPRFDDWILAYSDSTTNETASLYFVGAQVGYRWIFDSGFEMAISLGAMANILSSISYNNSTKTEQPPFKGVALPAVDYDLGYAF